MLSFQFVQLFTCCWEWRPVALYMLDGKEEVPSQVYRHAFLYMHTLPLRKLSIGFIRCSHKSESFVIEPGGGSKEGLVWETWLRVLT